MSSVRSRCASGRGAALPRAVSAHWAYANTDYNGPVLSQHEMPWRDGQDLVFLLWLLGVPSLAGGLALDLVPFVSAGAWCLLVATLADAANVTRVLRHAFTARPTR
jgi:hypothetical protein